VKITEFNGFWANGVPRIVEIPWEIQSFQHLATKVPHLTELHQKSPNFIISSEISLKIIQSAKTMIWMIWTDFGDPRADSPLQNLCNSLGFSWSGQVSCVPWGAGTVFRDFSAFYENSGNLHKNMKFQQIL